jgi:hypothetical protein
MSYSQPLSTELALRAFEADCAFSAALAALQAESHGVSGLVALLAKANQHGFCWIIKPKKGGDDYKWQVSLRHAGGAEESAYGNDVEFLLLHLLGFPPFSTAQAPEAEVLQDTHPALDGSPEHEAPPAEVVLAKPVDLTTPLTEQQQVDARKLVQQLDAEQRKAFTISFRDAFKVPREVKAIAPLITELQHLHFVDRFTIEMAGEVAP